MKISTRLLLLVGLMSALLIGVGGLGLYGISASNAALQTVYEDRVVPLGQLADIQRMMVTNGAELTAAALEATPERITESRINLTVIPSDSSLSMSPSRSSAALDASRGAGQGPDRATERIHSAGGNQRPDPAHWPVGHRGCVPTVGAMASGP